MIACTEAFLVAKAPWTNLTQAGSLLGAGCCGALEFLLNVRHKVGAGPRGVVGLAQSWGGASLGVWHFEPFQTLIEFSFIWREKKMHDESFQNIEDHLK